MAALLGEVSCRKRMESHTLMGGKDENKGQLDDRVSILLSVGRDAGRGAICTRAYKQGPDECLNFTSGKTNMLMQLPGGKCIQAPSPSDGGGAV